MEAIAVYNFQRKNAESYHVKYATFQGWSLGSVDSAIMLNM